MKQKVKLIASDLDGTLLQNYMPDCSEEAIELITALTKKGVIFVPASGRQYLTYITCSKRWMEMSCISVKTVPWSFTRTRFS